MTRYRVDISWYGELHTCWTHARTEKGAMYHAAVKLASKLGRNPLSVFTQLCNGHTGSVQCEVKEEK